MDNVITAKPVLRWAGGKNWLVKHLPDIFMTTNFKSYHEPFLGGASIFLSIQVNNKSFLSDLNQELISAYSTLKDDPEAIIDELKTYENTEDFYYRIRKQKFKKIVKKAARFIYLNQTSFNGIYRVNLKGEYNVPFGYRTKEFLESDKLRSVSNKLQGSMLFSGDFDLIKQNIGKRDLVFLDPPYTVSHNDNGFIKYNQKLFSLKDQERLSLLIDYIKGKDAYYVMTNAASMKILEIFEKGDKRIVLKRANLIGGLNAKRGRTSEYIFTNIKV